MDKSWWDAVPTTGGRDRDEYFLKAEFDPITYARILIGPITLFVMTDALKVDGVRLTVGHRGAQRIADKLRHVLPTTKISDLVWARCPRKRRLTPITRDWNYTSPVTGMRTTRMIEQSAAVDALIHGDVRDKSLLVADVGKDWVTSDLLASPGGSAKGVNYGWRRQDGRPWQNANDWHEADYSDYSQVYRGVYYWALLNDKPTPVEDILASTAFAHWIAPVPEGKIPKVTRHPGVEDARLGHVFTGFDINITDTLETPAMNPNEFKFVQARNFTKGRRTRDGRECGVDLVVLHSMEHPERPNAAEAVAAWVAGPSAPKASWHYAVDCDSVVQSVSEGDTAWHASGANHNGIGIEHAGYARQTDQEWFDGYSLQMLQLSAKLVREVCARHQIPHEFVDAEKLIAGARGITTHAEVSKASMLAFKRKLTSSPFFNHKTNGATVLGAGHNDPGKGFPLTWYMDQVAGK